jgi:hypothetical protein
MSLIFANGVVSTANFLQQPHMPSRGTVYNAAMVAFRYLEQTVPAWTAFAGKAQPAVWLFDILALGTDFYQLSEATDWKRATVAAAFLGVIALAGVVVPKLDEYFQPKRDLEQKASWERPHYEVLHQWTYAMRAIANLTLAAYSSSRASLLNAAMQIYCLVQTSRKTWIKFEKQCDQVHIFYYLLLSSTNDGKAQACKDHSLSIDDLVSSIYEKMQKFQPTAGAITREQAGRRMARVHHFTLSQTNKLGCPNCQSALQEHYAADLVNGLPSERARIVFGN